MPLIMGKRALSLALIPLLILAAAAAGPSHEAVFVDVRAEARALTEDWVRTASVANLNDLSLRTAAFAGLVPNTQVTLDGRTLVLDRVLIDSVNTILSSHTEVEDAQAVRNITYALNEVAKGNTCLLR